MSRIEILMVPELYVSYRKSVKHLEESRYRDLFVNHPKVIERHLSDVANNEVSYRDLINRIREEKLIPEPIDGWRYPVEPLLKSLPKLKEKKPGLEIYCYVDPRHHRLRIEKASEVARLTLRSNITGRVEVEKWRNTIMDWVKRKSKELEREADLISRKAGKRALCISGYNGNGLERFLKRTGHEVTRKGVEAFYHHKPIEVLEEKLEKSKGRAPNEEIKTLVKEHLKYVNDYVLKNNTRDQAYWKWAFDNYPDVAERYNLEEIEALGHIVLEEI